MAYTIKKLADLAGVSIRTLHYYDEIGLLKPSSVGENGYRLYEEKELLKLQQILFFKELDFELEQIQKFLNAPNYNALEILKDQKELIHKKKEHLEKLITIITNTITTMKKKKKIQENNLYGSLTKEQYENYKKEAQEKWGKENIDRSESIVKSWSKEKFAEIGAQGEVITQKLATLVDQPVESEEVQTAIDAHFKHIIQFYDKSWPHLKIYRGLANMYVDDERFAAFYNKYNPKLAKFMQKAMTYYCDQKEKV